MEKSFYEIRPYLFLIIALYALTNADEFLGYLSGASLLGVTIFVIRSRFAYRIHGLQ